MSTINCPTDKKNCFNCPYYHELDVDDCSCKIWLCNHPDGEKDEHGYPKPNWVYNPEGFEEEE